MTATDKQAAGSPMGDQESTAQAAREQTSHVGQSVMQAGGQVAQTAVEQGKQVAKETGRQAQNLLGSASSQLKEQTGAQQKRAAGGLRALGDELQSMCGRGEQQGLAGNLVRHASDTAHQAANWLEQREPGTVVNELRDYARRNPGMFLAGTALVGMLAGRLTRNLGSADGGRAPTPQPDTAPVAQPAQAPPPSPAPGPTGHEPRRWPSGSQPEAR